jgi:hypothetical protein
MYKFVESLNSRKGFVTIEAVDDSIIINNNGPHIAIKSTRAGGSVDSLNKCYGNVNSSGYGPGRSDICMELREGADVDY